MALKAPQWGVGVEEGNYAQCPVDKKHPTVGEDTVRRGEVAGFPVQYRFIYCTECKKSKKRWVANAETHTFICYAPYGE